VEVTESNDGSRAFIEVKFTEAGFGTGKIDDRLREKLDGIYRLRLGGGVSEECFEAKHFFANYQLYRNLSALRPGHPDVLVLLLLRLDAAVWSGGITQRRRS
jgi:hypothetical protein